MDVKQAVQEAKSHILYLFGEEGVTNLGLEEVDFDADAQAWTVTVGFSRPWDKPPTGSVASALAQLAAPKRDYKVVRIDDATGKVRSVKNRESKS